MTAEDRGKTEGAEGADGVESLSALRGVRTLKEASVAGGWKPAGRAVNLKLKVIDILGNDTTKTLGVKVT